MFCLYSIVHHDNVAGSWPLYTRIFFFQSVYSLYNWSDQHRFPDSKWILHQTVLTVLNYVNVMDSNHAVFLMCHFFAVTLGIEPKSRDRQSRIFAFRRCDLFREVSWPLWFVLRRVRDLNPRAAYATYLFSKQTPSTAWVTLRFEAGKGIEPLNFHQYKSILHWVGRQTTMKNELLTQLFRIISAPFSERWCVATPHILLADAFPFMLSCYVFKSGMRESNPRQKIGNLL